MQSSQYCMGFGLRAEHGNHGEEEALVHLTRFCLTSVTGDNRKEEILSQTKQFCLLLPTRLASNVCRGIRESWANRVELRCAYGKDEGNGL
jgi:hypothetical protein